MLMNDLALLLDLFRNSEETKFLICTVIFCLVFTASAKWRVELRAKIGHYRNRCFVLLSGYTILLTRDSGFTGTMTTAVVGDLKGTLYYFKVRACTRAGMGPSSGVVHVELNCPLNCNDSGRPPYRQGNTRVKLSL